MVHAAYRALEAEGLVTSSRGHGTVVRQRAPLKRLGIARYDKAKWRDGDEVAFIADRVASGRSYRRNEQTQTVSRVKASAVVAEAHGLPEGAEVYARARVVREGSQPTHTLTSYYRPEHVEGTRLVDPTPGPAGRGGGFRVLYDAGYEIDHMQETLFARVPTAEEAQLSSSHRASGWWSSTAPPSLRTAPWWSSRSVFTQQRASRGHTTSRCPTRRTTGEGPSDLGSGMGRRSTALGLPTDGTRGAPLLRRYRPRQSRSRRSGHHRRALPPRHGAAHCLHGRDQPHDTRPHAAGRSRALPRASGRTGRAGGSILLEPHARNTGENIRFSRALLEEQSIPVSSVLLVSKPYEERRAYATACKLWPEVEWVSASARMFLTKYIDSIQDARLVIDMLVGTQQRLMIYPRQGFIVEQHVPDNVAAAYRRLREAGFTSRIVPDPVAQD